MKKIYISFIAASIAASIFSANAFAQEGIGFIENKGQIHDQYYFPNPSVKYLLNRFGCNIQLRQTGFSYDRYESATMTKDGYLLSIDDKEEAIKTIRNYHRVDVEFIGANKAVKLISEEPLNDHFNYYNTVTPEEGAVYVMHYKKITYKNIYPNIDLIFYTKAGASSTTQAKDHGAVKENDFKYNFVIHPGGRVEDIKLNYYGMNDLKISANNGGLDITVAQGMFTETIPRSFLSKDIYNMQKADTKEIKVLYKLLENGRVTFIIPKYDRSQTLIIDPAPNLVWGTYYGAGGSDHGREIAIDGGGNVLVSGVTTSSTAIATAGTHQTVYGGNSDAFVVKLNASGVRQWCTYYGGGNLESGDDITIGSSNSVLVTGWTESASAISSAGAHQTVFGGGTYDAFLLKLNSSGVRQWSTYYGGTARDEGYGIARDASDNVIIAGYTQSATAIATGGAHQTTHGGGTNDGFIAKFNSSGVRQWATYYGGTDFDYGHGLIVDVSNNVLLSGTTDSPNAISTAGTHQTVFGGNGDGYLVKFNSSGVRQWATYYGGSSSDISSGIVLDAGGNILLTGRTQSTSTIATAGAHQTTYGGGTGSDYDAYVVKFNSSGVRQWGTYYGGSIDDYGIDIATDGSSNVLITGWTESPNAIATTGAHQTVYGGGTLDAFFVKFNSSGVRQCGTYYGGTGDDRGYGIVTDGSGDVYLTGPAGSSSNITTAGAHQSVHGGGGFDGYIAKFDNVVSVPVKLLFFDARCKNDVIQLSWITASEFNNDFFTIERSADAKNFTPIGTVKGAGNSSTLINYPPFVDNDPINGTAYYRLSQTDYNGTSEVFSPVSVSCSGNSGFSVTVNPNPISDGNIYVSVNGAADENVLVVLTDVLGRERYSKIIVEQSDGYLFNINLQDKLASGVYFVTASANDKYFSKKIVVK